MTQAKRNTRIYRKVPKWVLTMWEELGVVLHIPELKRLIQLSLGLLAAYRLGFQFAVM